MTADLGVQQLNLLAAATTPLVLVCLLEQQSRWSVVVEKTIYSLKDFFQEMWLRDSRVKFYTHCAKKYTNETPISTIESANSSRERQRSTQECLPPNIFPVYLSVSLGAIIYTCQQTIKKQMILHVRKLILLRVAGRRLFRILALQFNAGSSN